MKTIGSMLVVSFLLVAVIANRPRFLTERPNREMTSIEKRSMRYFGLPTLWGFITAMLALLFPAVFSASGSEFLAFIFRLAIGLTLMFAGINVYIHGVYIWPRSETDQALTKYRWIPALVALLMLALGGLSLLAAYRW